jgi:hypothetical protein
MRTRRSARIFFARFAQNASASHEAKTLHHDRLDHGLARLSPHDVREVVLARHEDVERSPHRARTLVVAQLSPVLLGRPRPRTAAATSCRIRTSISPIGSSVTGLFNKHPPPLARRGSPIGSTIAIPSSFHRRSAGRG